MNEAACHICGVTVPTHLQLAHLTSTHPTPVVGFRFSYEGREYRSDQPSMTVSELLRLVGGSAMHQFCEQRDGQMFPLSHGNAVDLTREPRFYSVPYATY